MALYKVLYEDFNGRMQVIKVKADSGDEAVDYVLNNYPQVLQIEGVSRV